MGSRSRHLSTHLILIKYLHYPGIVVGKHTVLAETIVYLMHIGKQQWQEMGILEMGGGDEWGDGWGHLINYLDFGRRVAGKQGKKTRLSQAEHRRERV